MNDREILIQEDESYFRYMSDYQLEISRVNCGVAWILLVVLFIVSTIYVRPVGVYIFFLIIWVGNGSIIIYNTWRSLPGNMKKRYVKEKEDHDETMTNEIGKKEQEQKQDTV